ncbi:MAG: hypothetical protein JXB38_14645, partial [Anaerolineales bacterium]|nr:hypothetical protein [Anaerolineales bacterium]
NCRTLVMGNRSRFWEFLYIFVDSSIKALLWLIPVLISVFSFVLYTSTPFIDVPLLIGIIVICFVFVGVVQFYINKKLKDLRVFHNEVIELLRTDRNNKIQEISSREARAYPDTGYVALGEYTRLIEAIHSKGFIEFECQIFPEVTMHPKKSMRLYRVAAGMSQNYLVGNQRIMQTEQDALFRIYAPDGVDGRDFSLTWFEYIFRILGNTCSSISELQMGDYYIIKKYKIYKRKGHHYFRIYIS